MKRRAQGFSAFSCPHSVIFSCMSKIGEVDVWFWVVMWCDAALCRTTSQRKIHPSLNLPRLAEDPWGLTGRCTIYSFNIYCFNLTYTFCDHTFCVWVWLQKELPKKTDCPHMCAYKLVTVKFKWWGLQNKVENFIQKVSSAAFNPEAMHVYASNYHFQTLYPFRLDINYEAFENRGNS